MFKRGNKVKVRKDARHADPKFKGLIGKVVRIGPSPQKGWGWVDVIFEHDPDYPGEKIPRRFIEMDLEK
ncbi:hypothetical protein H1164_08345 [Thermoactinomyces daqus]|uniref:Uncharacterized protein n=1 Tax=Thermoactinomyces daqus TaxID=1329516 RepID=A0A7W2AI51_9BACL|nr:hypothetical protein [Thermoactinomyces daqus]MBA4542910.1 hypothetical protein [Thermoactinomyces daqus]